MMSLGIVVLEEFSKESSGSSDRADQFDSERAGQAHKSLLFLPMPPFKNLACYRKAAYTADVVFPY